MKARFRSVFLVVALACVGLVVGDVYLHNPRGSNNRLDEQNENRANAQRLFDSENNNQGGVNVGNIYYYAGSTIPVEWTNQHSCNTQHNQCQIILQYLCDNMDGEEGKMAVRDGTTTDNVDLNTNPSATQIATARSLSQNVRYGTHESFSSFEWCSLRERQKGLFVSSQDFNNNQQTARATRQDQQGTKHGNECPEERDYYPYWHYSEWHDIAVLTSDTSRCDYYKSNSANVAAKYMCSETTYNNQAQCEGSGATWYIPQHQTERFAAGIDGEPVCQEPPASRINHLGNTAEGEASMYTWIVPEITAEACTMRIRYNISTTDYDDWDNPPTNTVTNGGTNNAIDLSLQAVYKDKFVPANTDTYDLVNDPTVNYGNTYPMTLNINTAQFGRTFQDRSHTFAVKSRPEGVSGTIHNINVRGRRGNIVECYPAVEYDFTPNNAKVTPGDWVHFQWTGSNTNNNNADGEGVNRSDRSNIVELENPSYNQAMGDEHMTMLTQNLLEHFALSTHDPDAAKHSNTRTLDNMGTWFDGGLKQYHDEDIGTYYYMSSRNNNFSNRSQKGTLSVGYFDDTATGLSTLEIVLIAVFVPVGSVCICVVVLGVLLTCWIWHPAQLDQFALKTKALFVVAFNKICNRGFDPYDTEKGLYSLASRPGEPGAEGVGYHSRFEKK